jgi:diguanylate cyclase (GGDEF)-like protein/putative nucleotidyltransferase with HDIG domain
MNKRAQFFIAATSAAGISLLIAAALQWHSQDPLRFVVYLVLALASAGFKVALPGMNGTMSVTFLFMLLAILELSLPEALAIGCAVTLLQCLTKMSRPTKWVRVLFNVCSNMVPAIFVANWVFHHSGALLRHSTPLMLMATAAAFFLFNTLPIATVISLSENRHIRQTWTECHFWSFPYYLAGAALVAFVSWTESHVGWGTAVALLPIVYWIYRSYCTYIGRLEDNSKHVGEMASLHLRTIEALALAIDAKDHTTHDHLQRVRVYALAIGQELKMKPQEIEALKAAALLHDIGKLAVPEYIINKPGRLTVEEFDKMKIHPEAGAKILERVKFPYPVVPIVRCHHEKWDGTGYPAGLKGEDIPIGARILSAVDCLDALASDRQYRRALPLDKAMEHVAKLAGKDFDPKVVDILKRRYIELEKMAHEQPFEIMQQEEPAPATQGGHGEAPDAGFEQESQPAQPASEEDFIADIAAARQEAQTLYELSDQLGAALSTDEMFSFVSLRLRKLVPFDAVVVWLKRNDELYPAYVSGDNYRLFASLRIPVGQGLSGWVVQNAKAILNGNPSVEPGYLNDAKRFSILGSALSVPLEAPDRVIGAFTLYRTEANAFNKDNQRVLSAICCKLALAVESALKLQQAQSSASTEYLTGLPNLRALFLHLHREISRANRLNTELCVMACHLNGLKELRELRGHAESNRVLQEFSTLLLRSCREYDYVACLGAGDFAIVAPGIPSDVVAEMAQRISAIAARLATELGGGNHLSVSTGKSFLSQDGTDAEQLLAHADRRMHAARPAPVLTPSSPPLPAPGSTVSTR